MRQVVATACPLRYRADGDVGADYRDTGSVDWFVHRPSASFWPDSDEAADLLATSARLARLDLRRVRVRHTDGTLTAPGGYGLPRP